MSISKDVFIQGYKRLGLAFHKHISDRETEVVYEEFFSASHLREKVLTEAISRISRSSDAFPRNPAKAIHDEMANIVVRREDHHQGCGICDNGVIHFKVIRRGGTDNSFASYTCGARCICEAGQVNYLYKPFMNGRIPPEEFMYGGEIYVVPITAVELMEMGNDAWEVVCGYRGWDTDVIERGILPMNAEIWLNLGQAAEIGLDVDKFIKDAEEYERLVTLMSGKTNDEAREIALAEMSKLGIEIRRKKQETINRKPETRRGKPLEAEENMPHQILHREGEKAKGR